jgi:hypothetical protein
MGVPRIRMKPDDTRSVCSCASCCACEAGTRSITVVHHGSDYMVLRIYICDTRHAYEGTRVAPTSASCQCPGTPDCRTHPSSGRNQAPSAMHWPPLLHSSPPSLVVLLLPQLWVNPEISFFSADFF